MSKTDVEVEKTAFTLTADGYAEIGNPQKALEYYAKAGIEPPRLRLVECGDVCMNNDNPDGLEDAFAAFNAAKDREKLIKCGNKCLKLGFNKIADKAYRAAARLCR